MNVKHECGRDSHAEPNSDYWLFVEMPNKVILYRPIYVCHIRQIYSNCKRIIMNDSLNIYLTVTFDSHLRNNNNNNIYYLYIQKGPIEKDGLAYTYLEILVLSDEQ